MFDSYSFIPNSHKNDVKFDKWLSKLSKNASILTYYFDNILVGTLFFYDNEVAVKNDEGFCTYFCVFPEFRRSGIASQMLQVIKLHLNRKGISRFKLKCAKSNIAAYRLYRKNGFFVVDSNEDDYTLLSLTAINA